jgi:YidC/Oxa1 family membrane protein insertase
MDNLRLILVVALAAVLFLMYQAWQKDYGSSTRPPTIAQPATGPAGQQAPSDLPAPPMEQPSTSSAELPVSAPGDVRALPSSQRISVRTDLLSVEIDTTGGDLRRADLLAYPVSLEDPNTPFELLSDTATRLFIAQSGLIAKPEGPTHHTVFTTQQANYSLPDGADTLQVPLTWHGPNGLIVTKTYTFHRNSYKIGLSYQVENGASKPWSGRVYAQLQRRPPAEGQKQRFIYTFTGAVVHSEQNRYEKIKFEDIQQSPLSRNDVGGWAAMIQHYFVAAVIPTQQTENHYYTKALSDDRYAVGVVTPSATVEPGAATALDVQFYIGPKDQHRLEAAAPGLQLTVDYGVLTIIAEPLFWLLEHIHGVVRNWGWSIVILTILIKLAFFHLSATSYKSMANMRRMQPRMIALKERYSDDKTRLNQAMMELYKKEKINPLGGCLPIVVQIPVFISLYWVLLESVELRQAPFMFWIKDLATYDPYFVLPLLMGISMFAQQRLNPAPMDPIQQKIMMALPIVFTVFFLFFPSGLVLYWFVNNTLSIAQQWVITRRIEKATS